MKLTLLRHTYAPNYTLGSLYLGDEFECFTLEDANRLALGFQKIPKQTAIPAGSYTLVISYSRKFGRLMPLLLAVPGFEGIRIHSGNTPEHTEGCPLTGTKLANGTIWHSRDAYNALFRKLQQAEREGGIVVDVVNGTWPVGVENHCTAHWMTEGARARLDGAV